MNATGLYDRVALIDAIESVVGREHQSTGLITEIADAVAGALHLGSRTPSGSEESLRVLYHLVTTVQAWREFNELVEDAARIGEEFLWDQGWWPGK